ncbi:MAG TPA: transporter associated domain-containing protein [Steroidobacteraceae bacterium]|nr:transporter associated domain-containing protein [Steroidobacteraceae bacterium]
MAEPARGRPTSGPSHPKSLRKRLSAFILREPENRNELLQVLSDAHDRKLLDADALSMIEGVLQVAELRARDLMVPSAQMHVLDVADPVEQWIPRVIESGHSRFPVIEGNRDQVLGILLAKDLLRFYARAGFDPRALLRPAVFIPESKPLNVLLREFRANRNHMALVVDEYGGIAGLITIEDVLEQIVGDIEDEYDANDIADNIVAEHDGRFRVKALTEIEDLNAAFGTHFSDARFDTVGGLVTDALGRVPHRGDIIELEGVRFEVLRADARQAHLLLVTRLAKTLVEEFEALDMAGKSSG